MDKEQKKRITSNITFLKERLGYLDPILERLVEKNVISVEQRDRVEKVNPPTPHRKFNEFIQLLLNSHEPHAFNIFIEVLEDERFFNIVEKLQKDSKFKNQNFSQYGYIILKYTSYYVLKLFGRLW